MLKNKIEQTLREFIPHSASYCIPDLVKCILELVEKCVPEERQTGELLKEKTTALRTQLNIGCYLHNVGYNLALTQIRERIRNDEKI